MQKLPFMPFYVNDWETDVAVRLMGPVARSYYLALLIIQWREGSIPSDREVSKRILLFPKERFIPMFNGEDEEDDRTDYDHAMDQALACFEDDGNGGLINKKLESLRKYHLSVQEAKSKGGKSKHIRDLQRVQVECQKNQNQNQNQNQKDTVLSLRKKEPKKARPEYTTQFELFWSRYPRSNGKFQAFQEFQKVNPQNGDLERIINAVEIYKRTEQWKEPKYIPYASTFLHKRLFEDIEETL